MTCSLKVSSFILQDKVEEDHLCIAGRYEDEFIDHRMKLLQMWVDRICRHPVLSRSEVFLHFLTCTDEKVRQTKFLVQLHAFCHLLCR